MPERLTNYFWVSQLKISLQKCASPKTGIVCLPPSIRVQSCFHAKHNSRKGHWVLPSVANKENSLQILCFVFPTFHSPGIVVFIVNLLGVVQSRVWSLCHVGCSSTQYFVKHILCVQATHWTFSVLLFHLHARFASWAVVSNFRDKFLLWMLRRPLAMTACLAHSWSQEARKWRLHPCSWFLTLVRHKHTKNQYGTRSRQWKCGFLFNINYKNPQDSPAQFTHRLGVALRPLSLGSSETAACWFHNAQTCNSWIRRPHKRVSMPQSNTDWCIPCPVRKTQGYIYAKHISTSYEETWAKTQEFAHTAYTPKIHLQ